MIINILPFKQVYATDSAQGNKFNQNTASIFSTTGINSNSRIDPLQSSENSSILPPQSSNQHTYQLYLPLIQNDILPESNDPPTSPPTQTIEQPTETETPVMPTFTQTDVPPTPTPMVVPPSSTPTRTVRKPTPPSTRTAIPPTSNPTPVSPTSNPAQATEQPAETETPVNPTFTETDVPPIPTPMVVPPSSTPTQTVLAPTPPSTRTAIPPTSNPAQTSVTPTLTDTPELPTFTQTALPPTLTQTPVLPTFTPTAVLPTSTPTSTRTVVPPTSTRTPTLTRTTVPPTSTRTPTLTRTTVPPTSTPGPTSTRTAVPPTSTPTAVPPTATSAPEGNIFYVSLSGSDTNPGTLAQPFKTIQHAVDLVHNPGDTVLVMPGEYHSTSLYAYDSVDIINKHGNSGREIVVRAYDLNNKPIIVNRGYGFWVENSSYIILDGFEVKDFTRSGISINTSNNITVGDNYVHLSFQGLCKSGEGLPLCKADGTGTGQVKGRIDNLGNYILEDDNKQNPGIHLAKVQNSTLDGNRIQFTDEGIYAGTAENVVLPWTSGNVIENNIIDTATNEGIELKSDAIRTIVKSNLLKNSAGFSASSIEIRSAYNDVSENVIFGDNSYSVEGIRTKNDSICNNPPNDEFGNSMLLYPISTGYTCSFRNNVHNNYIYYTQGADSLPSISNVTESAANIFDHNTIVGGNSNGIMSDGPFVTITNNLIIGNRGTNWSLLTQSSTREPLVGDFNAYYPNLKTNGGCIVSIAGATVVCETGQNTTYEVHSVFMPSSPVGSFQPDTSPIKIDAECSQASLSALSLEVLKDAIKNCSTPLNNIYGNQIVSTASDGTNIGAW